MIVARSLSSALKDKIPGSLPIARRNSMLRVKSLSFVGAL
jgi:hypothetical protein